MWNRNTYGAQPFLLAMLTIKRCAETNILDDHCGVAPSVSTVDGMPAVVNRHSLPITSPSIQASIYQSINHVLLSPA